MGYPHELWTYDLLVQHIRKECLFAGYPMLVKFSPSTLSEILLESNIRPHKISHYLERRDPDFKEKMAEVLYLYEEVDLIREFGESDFMEKIAIISYGEKPGVQAIANTSPDLPPVPGIQSCTFRDHEYKRQGTVSLLAGIDLLTGYVHGRVEDRHRSKEFVDFMKDLDKFYSDKDKIKVLLDNHSAHISKETRGFWQRSPIDSNLLLRPNMVHG